MRPHELPPVAVGQQVFVSFQILQAAISPPHAGAIKKSSEKKKNLMSDI